MSLHVIRPGLLTTVQDLGRAGWQRYGVVVGGAMDMVALRIANLLAGNSENTAVLEATLLGPTLGFVDDRLFAVCGGDLGAMLDDVPVPVGRACVARAGSILSFTGARAGCRAYVAVSGGIAVPAVLGSRSTDLRAGWGGVSGRALVAGDVLPLGEPSPVAMARHEALVSEGRVVASWGAGRSFQPMTKDLVVRVLRGLEHDRFTEASRNAFFASSYVVSARSDRMGYRLEGPALSLTERRELITAPIAIGTVQVPPGGQPIVLMADRQSAGGYPRIAQVITVDLPVLAQAVPGNRVRFRETSLDEAELELLKQERNIRQFADALSKH